MKTRQIVQVIGGRVYDEINRLFLGRYPPARDGTYLWEVFDSGHSLLIPISGDKDAKTFSIDDQGFLPSREQSDEQR